MDKQIVYLVLFPVPNKGTEDEDNGLGRKEMRLLKRNKRKESFIDNFFQLIVFLLMNREEKIK